MALGDSIGRGLHLHLQDEQPLTLASIGALLASAIALVRKLAVLFDEKSAGGWLARLPLPALAGVGALLTGLLWLALWSLFVQWTLARLSGSEPWLLVGAMLLTVGFGYWRGWLDLTSLRPFYERRLVRAYLGATNRVRFQSQDAAAYSSAEPIAGDDLNFDACLRTQGAPLHLINVTLNQTVGPGERLVQLDRKGKPLCVRPALEQPFLLEGQPCRFEKAPAEVGYWTALSGAAFSTGIGRLTSPGLSWLCGMANIRLGSWLRLKDQGKEPPWTTCLPTFTLLANEWRGHFHGSHGNWQYLSDGGHFENLGVYELLRPGRDVRLIIACDCGADPDYQFEDLANLVRLARVDFGREIEVDEEAMAVLQPAAARRVFATPQQLRQAELARRAGQANPPHDDACAVLLRVRPAGESAPVCHIVLVKPRVPAGVPVDVTHYAALNSAFPQQTTVDQFFDDQQWESYRKLGLVCGERVVRALASSGEVARWLCQPPEQAVNREGA